ncbi:unnamed protein product [Rotaria sp. Silwood2]|nr:unnamed protein product [Rotaria sp. Silwood2]
MLMKVNEKLLLVFNNIFVREYIDQIHQGIYKNSNKDNLPSYQKITEEKFLRIVDLMGKIRVTKEILDQLSDASLSVWDTILYEIEFTEIFNREMNKCGIEIRNDDSEKAILFLNRIRVQVESIYYRKITFKEANEIVLKKDYKDWHKIILEKMLLHFKIDNKSDRSAKQIIDQMIMHQKKTN